MHLTKPAHTACTAIVVALCDATYYTAIITQCKTNTKCLLYIIAVTLNATVFLYSCPVHAALATARFSSCCSVCVCVLFCICTVYYQRTINSNSNQRKLWGNLCSSTQCNTLVHNEVEICSGKALHAIKTNKQKLNLTQLPRVCNAPCVV